MPSLDSRPALNLLQGVYGYEAFRGDQEAIIEHVVGGGDAGADPDLGNRVRA